MKGALVFVLFGAQALSISAYGSAKEGRCPQPKGNVQCSQVASPPCSMDIECTGTQKCCDNGCGGYTCKPAILPPKPVQEQCVNDPAVTLANQQNPECLKNRTTFCYKDNCKRCCDTASSCNPNPNLYTSVDVCTKVLCAKKTCYTQGEICIMDKRYSKPKCVCPERCPPASRAESVCGTDKITYPSRCEMNLTACVLGTIIGIAYPGECRRGQNKVTISPSHVKNQFLKAGKRGKITCQFEGDPVQIIWDKVGLERLPSNRMLPQENVLVIKSVKPGDAGVYMCSAFDGVVAVAASVNVSVQEPKIITLKAIKPRSVCLQDKLIGTGSKYVVRFFFNSATRLCEPFVFSGSGGNENNFASKETCKRACSHSASEVCSLPKLPGPCMARFQKWYYDTRTAKCKMFVYGGCRGNANNFDNKKACLRTCSAQHVCSLPKVVGTCNGHTARYFFDSASKSCKKFIYSGCEGNSNQFHSRKQCERKCLRSLKRVNRRKVKPGVCQAPRFDVSSCSDHRRDSCMSDMDCAGKAKCCFDGCHMSCSEPLLKARIVGLPKLGRCPSPKFSAKICENRYETDVCQADHECPGRHKCCHNGCFRDCALPKRVPNGRPKPGTCPLVIDPSANCNKTTHECSSDNDCYGRQKCCDNSCHRECMNVPIFKRKPGQCPIQDAIEAEDCRDIRDTCSYDRQCPGISKCCFTGCKMECTSPPGIKPGVCPKPWKGLGGICDLRGDMCKGDYDCNGDSKCCYNGCQKDCVSPKGKDGQDKRKSKKPTGKCPMPWKNPMFCDRMGDRCSNDNDCYGNFRCCFNGCQKDCVQPVNLTKCQEEKQSAMDQLSDELPPLGVFVPSCTSDGSYEKVQCSGSIGMCWCVDSKGVEIQGTKMRGTPDCSAPVNLTKCQKEKRRATDLLSGEIPRVGVFVPSCTSDGSYEKVQCSGSIGMCWCVDSKGVEIQGTKMRGTPDCSAPVNLTKCQKEKRRATDLLSGEIPRVGVFVPSCTSDGSYEKVQCSGSIGMCWCVDSKGVEIQGTKMRGTPDCSAPDPREREGKCPKPWKGSRGFCDFRGDACDKDNQCPFNQKCCNNGCQRDCVYPDGMSPCQKHRKSASTSGLIIGRFTPKCRADGFYDRIQCHGSTGHCWCVDIYGNELPHTRMRETPNCNNPVVGAGLGVAGTCPNPTKGKNGICDRMGDECTIDSTCSGANQKCCFNGCQRQCLKAVPLPPEPKLTPCQKKLKEAKGPFGFPPPGTFLPTCNADGSFNATQCHSSVGDCWCVNTKTGEEIISTRISVRGGEQPPDCSDEGLTKCQKHYRDSLELPPIGRFQPSCEDSGKYESMQCHGSTGHCWCVDDDGKELTGTRMRGRPDCTPKLDPCAGVKCPYYGRCVASKEGSTSCVCSKFCTLEYMPMCGSDGKTYGNECEMKASICSSKKMITVVSRSECPKVDAKTCNDRITCSHPLQSCIMRNSTPICECPLFKCSSDKKPVCGTDNKTYHNECIMKVYACKNSLKIKVAHAGECKGIMSDPCSSSLCSHPQHTCNNNNNTAVCRCRMVTTLEYDPKCASDGKTYPNMMSMENAGCEKNMILKVVKDDRCESIEKLGTCPAPWKVTGICDRRGNMCQDDGSCNGTMKCCFSGCHRDCIHVADFLSCSENCGPLKQCVGFPDGSTRCLCKKGTITEGNTCRHPRERKGKCPKPWKGSRGFCDFRGDACDKDNQCLFNQKCCNNGCQRDCVYPDGMSPCQKHRKSASTSGLIIGRFTPKCRADGFYDRIQCHGSTGHCWCVDIYGNELPHTRMRETPNCNNPVVGAGLGVAGTCPNPTKGKNGICDRMGDECTIDSTCSGANQKCCFNGCQRQCLKAVPLPPEPKLTPCQKKLKEAKGPFGFPPPGTFLPTCNADGSFNATQCHSSVGDCWCVNTKTGEEIISTRISVRGGEQPPDCSDEVDPCAGVKCPYYGRCVASKEDSTSCVCSKFCTLEYMPICGSDGKTYGNECEMKASICSSKKMITVVSRSECPKVDAKTCNDRITCSHPLQSCIMRNSTPICECPLFKCSSDKKPVCGTDNKTYHNECIMNVYACKNSLKIKVAHAGECKGIMSDPCSSSLCSHPQHTCNNNNNTAICRCRMVTTLEYDPKCASDGKTYPNMMSMENAGCEKNMILKVVKDDRCESIEKLGTCPAPWKVTGICDRRGNMCQDDGSCNGTMKCCFSGCHRDCIHVADFLSCSENCGPLKQCVGFPDGSTRCLCKKGTITEGNTCRLENSQRTKPTTPQDICELNLCSFPQTRCVAVNGTATCECPKYCTRELMPVCGTDGKTYDNMCLLEVEACKPENTDQLMLEHQGPCNKTMNICETTLCSHPRQKCVNKGGKPTCECPVIACPGNYAPVCGSDGKTYSNNCSLEAAGCEESQIIKFVSPGPCQESESEKPGSCPAPWTGLNGLCNRRGSTCDDDTDCTGPSKCCFNGCQKDCINVADNLKCDEDCGPNEQCVGFPDKSTRCLCKDDTVMNMDGTCSKINKTKPEIVEPDDICDISLCSFPQSKCVVVNDTATCECPKYCTRELMPVCGTDGKTYDNMCLLEVEACKPENTDQLMLEHQGPCKKKKDICETTVCSHPMQKCVIKDGNPTCECPLIACIFLYAPVCGSDGKTYSNNCTLAAAGCKKSQVIKVVSQGRCPERLRLKPNPCDISLCSHPQHTCHNINNTAVCKCRMIMTTDLNPKCASDGKTYPNLMSMENAGCEKNMILKVVKDGKCETGDKPGSCPAPWTGLNRLCNRRGSMCEEDTDCTGASKCCFNGCQKDCINVADNLMCDEDCGLNKQCVGFLDGSTRCLCKKGTVMNMDGTCSAPSPHRETNPCDISLCAFPTTNCVVVNDTATCECPKVCTREYRPECGSDGKTYGNLCELAGAACKPENKGVLKLARNGACHDAPPNKKMNPCDFSLCNFPTINCEVVNETTTCECPKICTMEYKPVCGSDGKTYGNMCELAGAACKPENKGVLKLARFGACPRPSLCATKKCSLPYSVCKEINGTAQCVCRRGCTREYRPVIGSDGKKYNNLCLMQLASCTSGKLITVNNNQAERPGPSPSKPGTCPPTDPRPCPPIARPGADCRADKQCPGQSKCCHDGCSRRCMPPWRQVIPRGCPKVIPKACLVKYDRKEYCKTDSNCPRGQKCCVDGCIKRCSFFGPSPPGSMPGGNHGGAPGSGPSPPGSMPGKRRGGAFDGN